VRRPLSSALSKVWGYPGFGADRGTAGWSACRDSSSSRT
jgi:hypothetical protein